MANRSTINGSLLNGAARSVRAADAFLSFGAGLSGTVSRRGSGSAVISLDGLLRDKPPLQAGRLVNSGALNGGHPIQWHQVIQHGAGRAVLSLHAEHAPYPKGDALTNIAANLTASAFRRCSGDVPLSIDAIFLITHSAPIELGAALDASAIRCATSDTALELRSELSPAAYRLGDGEGIFSGLFSGYFRATRKSGGDGFVSLEGSLELVRAHQGAGAAQLTLSSDGQLTRYTELTTLLSGGLNGRLVDGGGPINAVRQLTLERGSGHGLTSLVATLDATRMRLGSGVIAPIVVSGALNAPVYRRTEAEAFFSAEIELLQQVSRSAAGTGVISLHTSLFYTRTQTGSGGMLLGLLAVADMGVRFGDGAAILNTLIPELDGQRHKLSSGIGDIELHGGLLASAIRRFAANDELKLIQGAALDPAHISSGGTRYITAGADSVIEPTTIIESGMRRGTGLGDVAFELFADVGAIRAVRHPQTSVGHIDFSIDQAFYLQRLTTGALTFALDAVGEGEIYVEAEGTTNISLLGEFTPNVYRRTAQGAAELGVESYFDGQRNKNSSSTGSMSLLLPEFAPIAFRQGFGRIKPELFANLDAYRKPVFDGNIDCELVAEGTCEIFIYPDGDAELELSGSLVGTAYKSQADVGKIELGLFSNFDGTRGRCAPATVGIEIHGYGDPIRLLGLDGYVPTIFSFIGSLKEHVYFDGQAEMEVLTSSDAYLNPYSEDPAEQTYYRPAEQREFWRPAEQKEYLRAA